ncbi:hypothetical protein HYZ99_02825 [Candidatus Peregrinibacteria bacterium]|nr:hypothetical protein [Candidatus Peregrinibacteria bacterium]
MPIKAAIARPTVVRGVALAVLLMMGLLLRLWIATSPGFEWDVGTNQGWAKSAVLLGLAQSYTEQLDGNMLPNYPPFSLILFGSIGHVYYAGWGDDFAAHPTAFRLLIKLPAILTDLGTALLFYFLLKRWRSRSAGLLAAAIFTFHPAVLYESAYWGQTDSIFTFFMTAALGLFAGGWMVAAGALIALALFTKVQTVMLGLFFLIISLLAGWKNFVKVCAGALPVAFLVLFPYWLGGNLQAAINVMADSVGYYSIVSSASYNLWWTVLSDSAGTIQDTELLFGIISYRHLGFLLFFLANIYVTALFWKRWRPFRPGRAAFFTLFAAAGFLAYTFFFVSTQMHERYLFPFVALGFPMAFINRKGALLYTAVSLLFLSNLMGWLPWTSIDRTLFSTFPTLDVLIAVCQLFAYIAVARYLFALERKILPPAKQDRISAWIHARLHHLRRWCKMPTRMPLKRWAEVLK